MFLTFLSFGICQQLPYLCILITPLVSRISHKTSERRCCFRSDISITTDTCHLNTQCVNSCHLGHLMQWYLYLDWPRTNRGRAQSEPLQPSFSAASYLTPFIYTSLEKRLSGHILAEWNRKKLGISRQLLCKVGGVASHPLDLHFHFFPHNTQKPTSNQLFRQNLCCYLKTSE